MKKAILTLSILGGITGLLSVFSFFFGSAFCEKIIFRFANFSVEYPTSPLHSDEVTYPASLFLWGY